MCSEIGVAAVDGDPDGRPLPAPSASITSGGTVKPVAVLPCCSSTARNVVIPRWRAASVARASSTPAPDAGRAVGLVLVDGLLVKQRLGQPVQRVAVLVQQPGHAVVRAIDEPLDRHVDQSPRLVRRRVLDERVAAVLRERGDEPDLLRHAPPADHGAGDAGHLVDGLRAGGDRLEDDLLRDAPAERDVDLGLERLAVVGDAVVVGEENVTPSARPRGMIDTLRTGSAPSVNMPTTAWPASW